MSSSITVKITKRGLVPQEMLKCPHEIATPRRVPQLPEKPLDKPVMGITFN